MHEIAIQKEVEETRTAFFYGAMSCFHHPDIKDLLTC